MRDALRSLVCGDKIEYEGQDVQLTWSHSQLPIWMAAYGPKALAATGEHADGLIIQLADPWLDEAFATYLAVEASESVPPQLSGVAGNVLAPAGDGPPIDLGIFDVQGNGQYVTAVYARGARFLAELRQTIGDPAWVSFLRTLYATYAGKVETPRAVLDLPEPLGPSTAMIMAQRLPVTGDKPGAYRCTTQPRSAANFSAAAIRSALAGPTITTSAP